MAIANYVLRRGQRFVWRRRLPCGEIVQISLGTAEPGRARHLAGIVTAKCNIIIQSMGKKLTAAEAKGLFDRVVREETAALDSRHLLFDPVGAELADFRVQAEILGRAMLAALRHGEISDGDKKAMAEMGFLESDLCPSAVHAWAALTQNAGFYAAPLRYRHAGSQARQIVERVLRDPLGIDEDHLLATYRVVLAGQAAALMPDAGVSFSTAAELRPSDCLDPDSPQVPVEWTAGTMVVLSGSAEEVENPTYDPSWHAVVERYIHNQAERGVKRAHQKLTRVTARLFAEANGVTDVRHIRQAHLAKFRDVLRGLHKNYGRSPKDAELSLAQLLERASNEPAGRRGLAPGTTNRHLSTLKSITDMARSDGIPITAVLNFKGLRTKDKVRKRNKRPAFSKEEILKIFQHPVWQGHKSLGLRRKPGQLILKDGLYWIPLIAAYTGARREDIAALTVGDIRKIDEIPCFHIRENINREGLKTLSTPRIIPIHPHLVELGFLDHVSAQKGNVFAELKRKHEDAGLGSSKQYMIDRILDDQIGVERGGKCFYSIRHYVTQQLRILRVPKEVRLDILGHEGEDLEDEVYGEDMPVDMKLEAIVKLPRVFK